jgi:L-alanine-DL-glutamate epimerase-like enolase superfamily enzyme
MVRIVEIREDVASMRSSIRNAFIDFTKMTSSVVAVVTDVVRDDYPVVGFGFNSNGRYAAQGILRERFIPRLLEAAPEQLATDDGSNLDPHKAWAVMMSNEKPGGHGERSVACGVLDMAMWDAVAKIEEQPLCVVLARRYGAGSPLPRVWVYAAGGYYSPDKDISKLQDEMRSYLQLGFTTVKMKIGGASLAEDLERIEAVLAITGGEGHTLAVDANGRFDLDTAVKYAEALAPYKLRWCDRLAAGCIVGSSYASAQVHTRYAYE